MTGIEEEEKLIMFYETHKSIGIVLLVFVILRAGLRFITGVPASLKTHTNLVMKLSRFAHWTLYILMLAMPVTGWLMSNAAGFAVPFFGLFDLPDLVDKDQELMELMQAIHQFLAVALLFLIGLHIIGALKHHFIDKDETLQRMTSIRLAMSGGAAVALIAVILWVTPVLLWLSGTGEENAAHSSAHDVEHATSHDTDHVNVHDNNEATAKHAGSEYQ